MALMPTSLVELVLKVSERFKLKPYDEFLILDSLEFALEKKFKSLMAQEQHVGENGVERKEEDGEGAQEKDAKINLSTNDMCVLILAVISLVEKFNKAVSSIGKKEIWQFLEELAIPNINLLKEEFEAFELMDFEVIEPSTFLAIYRMIEDHVDESCEMKMRVFNTSVDILRLVYCWKSQIHDEFSSQYESAPLAESCLWAAATLCTALKFLNFSDCTNLFEVICEKFASKMSPQKVNELSAIIYSTMLNGGEKSLQQ